MINHGEVVSKRDTLSFLCDFNYYLLSSFFVLRQQQRRFTGAFTSCTCASVFFSINHLFVKWFRDYNIGGIFRSSLRLFNGTLVLKKLQASKPSFLVLPHIPSSDRQSHHHRLQKRELLKHALAQ